VGYFEVQYSGAAANKEIAGSLHVFFEGYFVYNHARMSIMQDFFGQLWKEYALSDSRYMSSDPIVLCMESLTAVRCSMLQIFQDTNLSCTD
jgi:cholestenol Delta-isomerase